jgi:hypothetical protein
MKRQFNIGDIVRHTVPSMLYNQPGIILGEAGIKHGRRYVSVSYTNPLTKKSYVTAFWVQVLK